MANEKNNNNKDIEITTVFSNLNKEIKTLADQKKQIEDKIQGVKEHLESLRNKELELRDKIGILAKQEPKLNTERINMEKKLSLVSEKLEKTKKIFNDLSSVWK